ncbi:TlpA family protein disulfide reductase [Algoriphagus lacus]|uniref:TlpA family protein disulfide reductase n=1 Tax=Algoriphagus lacus TaxID=2056311 RepID=A0A418PVW1_9BACT|nr:TlpA disulfide reductase family protein [Algoriphagus lacus]RIW18219.1 TlpA family protein disulfide reductase [Algoriphagus lacus]
MKISYCLICFLLISFSVFPQNSPQRKIKHTWYSTDGRNELRLLLADDFALYQSQIWEMDSIQPGKYLLKNLDHEKQISISKAGENFFLEEGAVKISVQPEKSTNLKTRQVGQTDVSDSFFKKDQVLLQGLIVPKDSMPTTVSVIYNHAFGEGQRQFSSSVDDQGRFKLIFPLDYPQEVMVRAGSAIFTFFSKPGAQQAMVVYEKSFVNGIEAWTTLKELDFMGDLAVENEERRLLDPEFMKVRDYFVTDSLQKALEPMDFLKYRIGLMEKHQAFFNSYFDSIPVSPLTKEISLRGARIYAANDLRRYIWLHGGINEGRLNPVDVPDSYLQEVEKLMTGDLADLMAPDYAGLIREFTMPIQPSEMKSLIGKMDEMTYDFFKKQELNSAQSEAVDAWYDQIKKGVPRDSLILSEEYKSLSKTYLNQLSDFFLEVQWPHLLAKIQDLELIPRSSVIATYLDMNYQSVGKEIPLSIQNQLEEINLEPRILAIIREEIEDFERGKNERFVEWVSIAANGENILSQLKDKNPGKVIYVDVWATWCGPCISEFKHAATLKKDAPEGVVFAYICAQSERGAFENLVKKFGLEGEHFFLSQTEFEQFDKEFKITGFPTYLILTKEGKLIREGIHRPSSGDQLIRQLQEFVSR